MVTSQDLFNLQNTLTERKNDLHFQRLGIEQSRKNLAEQEKIIPRHSQAQLRVGGLSGLNGRVLRQGYKKTKDNIAKKRIDLELFKKNLDKFEQESVVPLEREINEIKTMWGF